MATFQNWKGSLSSLFNPIILWWRKLRWEGQSDSSKVSQFDKVKVNAGERGQNGSDVVYVLAEVEIWNGGAEK